MGNGVIGRGLDSGQVIETAYDPTYEAIDVVNIGGSLVPDLYDEIDLTRAQIYADLKKLDLFKNAVDC